LGGPRVQEAIVMRDVVSLTVVNYAPPIEPDPADQIREHLLHARSIATQNGFSSLVPFLEVAGHGLEEIERMKRPMPRVRIVR
jgi:hypothetical protein